MRRPQGAAYGLERPDREQDHPVLAGVRTGDHAYFVHSYHLAGHAARGTVAHVDYGGPVTAIVARGNRVGTQFHPEKSQATACASSPTSCADAVSDLQSVLDGIAAAMAPKRTGCNVATYIPELARVIRIRFASSASPWPCLMLGFAGGGCGHRVFHPVDQQGLHAGHRSGPSGDQVWARVARTFGHPFKLDPATEHEAGIPRNPLINAARLR